jgi:hypothetical protein
VTSGNSTLHQNSNINEVLVWKYFCFMHHCLQLGSNKDINTYSHVLQMLTLQNVPQNCVWVWWQQQWKTTDIAFKIFSYQYDFLSIHNFQDMPQFPDWISVSHLQIQVTFHTSEWNDGKRKFSGCVNMYLFFCTIINHMTMINLKLI